MTNFEKIKNMSAKELADCNCCHICCSGGCEYSWEQWLKSEVENNG